MSSTLPTRMINQAEFEIEGTPRNPGKERYTQYISAGPEYFRVMSVFAVAGREFNAGDERSVPLVAIVNQSFVDAFWPKVSPIGRRVRTIANDTPEP